MGCEGRTADYEVSELAEEIYLKVEDERVPR